jgi:hypothetical protein
MNIYLLIGAIVIIILLIFAFILHNARTPSTYARDYFNNAEKESENIEEPVDNALNEEVIMEDESVDESTAIRNEQTEKYLWLLDIHKNNKYVKQLKNNIHTIDLAEYDEMNDYISLSDLAELWGVSVEELITYLISEKLIEREHYTLVLTEKGIELGGETINHEDVEWIEFPKDLLDRLGGKIKTIDKNTNGKQYKDNNDIRFWFFVIVMILGYFFFFK